MSEPESELDLAIRATIAIGILDGTNKRERLAKSIERLLIAAHDEHVRGAKDLVGACAFLDATDRGVAIDNAGPFEWGATIGDGDDRAAETLALLIVDIAERLGWKR